MSTVIGGIVGALGAAFVVRRVREIKMYYADSGDHSVIAAVCTSSSCTVDHVDIDGKAYNNITLSTNDLILGGKVNIKSGRMFIMTAETAGML